MVALTIPTALLSFVYSSQGTPDIQENVCQACAQFVLNLLLWVTLETSR